VEYDVPKGCGGYYRFDEIKWAEELVGGQDKKGVVEFSKDIIYLQESNFHRKRTLFSVDNKYEVRDIQRKDGRVMVLLSYDETKPGEKIIKLKYFWTNSLNLK
jgi:hypothetical protein